MAAKSEPDNKEQPSNPDTASDILFETVYVDSAPKLRSSDHLVHYELGKLGENHAIRITSNDNDGLFSNEWLMLDDIAKGLEPLDKLSCFTSSKLTPLFKSKSSNNAGFLAAILRHEGVFGVVDKKMYQHYSIIKSANLIKHFTTKP